MKQLYKVPFERNSERVKELRYQDVQRIMELEGHETTHILVFVDEARFNLSKGQIGLVVTISLDTEPQLTHQANRPDSRTRIVRPHLPNYVVVWDNVSFRTNIVRDWFAAHERITVEFLPPYSPFLNPIEEFFSAWRWKVYDHRPQDQMSLLDTMNAACEDITADHCRGWVRHSRRFFPQSMALENIRCDVDENLWPDQQE
ncbi:Protein FAM243A [Labeo rohita]|uniref:Protein FAM243A n=1 Tax=Labeo rohita TaxID=84645 RepID=A0ABQ8LP81_LABRO|nr:Protein FAM243A [Labeo rohita]